MDSKQREIEIKTYKSLGSDDLEWINRDTTVLILKFAFQSLSRFF